MGGRATSTPEPEPSPTAGVDLNSVFHGFIYPLRGACLPKSDTLMPNASRAYRGGIHEGVDFYNSDSCTTIAKGMPVLAAKDGTVIRADRDYHPLTQAELVAADKRIADGHANDPDVLDLFRQLAHGGSWPTCLRAPPRIAGGFTAGRSWDWAA